MLLFWVLVLCRLVSRYQRFGGTYFHRLQGLSLHGAKIQKHNIVLIAVKTSNLIYCL